MSVNKYTPWHVDYWFGMGWLVAGMASGWWLVLSGAKLLAVVPTIWFSIKGWVRLERGLARERGVEVEEQAFQQLLGVIKSGMYFVKRNILMKSYGICYGNIDLVVSPVWTQASFVVEIKSFPGIVQRWYGLCRLGKYYRLWSPQKQVRQQCRFMGQRWHFPVLWLPESKLGTCFVYDDILIVNGDAALLLEALRWFNE